MRPPRDIPKLSLLALLTAGIDPVGLSAQIAIFTEAQRLATFERIVRRYR